jgi:hypothetical protein
VGENRTKMEGSSTTMLGYASFTPRPWAHVDALVGGSWLNLDNERYVTGERRITESTRKGDLRFGSAALTVESRFDGAVVAGYARYDFIGIGLHRFSEHGSSPYALAFDAAEQTMRLSVLGLRVDRGYTRAWGVVRPLARVEYRHRFEGSFDQIMAYSDMPLVKYTMSGRLSDRNLLSASAGATLSTGTASLSVEYGTSATSLDNFDGHSFRAVFRRAF